MKSITVIVLKIQLLQVDLATAVVLIDQLPSLALLIDDLIIPICILVLLTSGNFPYTVTSKETCRLLLSFHR